jgi:hypothetical protein
MAGPRRGVGSLTPGSGSIDLTLVVCGCAVVCHCDDQETAAILDAAFGGMRASTPARLPLRRFRVRRSDAVFQVSDGDRTRTFPDADSVLFHIDKEMTLALQLERRDLFFLHAAVVAREGAAIVLPAVSGTGKSTFTLALLEHGFDYHSDELAPIDVPTLEVHSYPHAVNLKTLPPAAVRLPSGAVRHGGRLHVPAPSAPRGPGRLAVFVFPQRSHERFSGLRPMSAAQGAARLMAHVLNPLAHPVGGLDAAVALARSVPCYELDIHDLPVAVDAVSAWSASCELLA